LCVCGIEAEKAADKCQCGGKSEFHVILIDAEEIVRVIGRLHCREPLMGAIVCGRTVIVVAGHETDVAPIAARVGMNSCVVVFQSPKCSSAVLRCVSATGRHL
jgi:hypothetical protein